MKIQKFLQSFVSACLLAVVAGGNIAGGQSVATSDAPPVIYNFISNSDYVVLAELEKIDPVAKFGKQDSNDLQDLVAGVLDTLKVEKTLYARDSLAPRQTFQVFVTMAQRFSEYYGKDRKYLIFLREIGADENLTASFELDNTQTFFRAFEGETSLFPYTGGFEGPPKKGIINLSDTRYQDLITRIEALTEALGRKDKKTRIENLKRLAESSDEELKINALYAIKVLQMTEK